MHPLSLLVVTSVVGSLAAASCPAATVDDLSWLAGCWAGDEAGSGEQWTAPAGGTLLGTGRQVRDGRTVSYEWLRIEETPEGSLAYVALPSGQAETRFGLAALDGQAVLFENPAHDFPQRVGYRLEGEVLYAHIEGDRDGQPRTIDFPMRRVACPGP